ncbi:MAG: hypothetical protein P8M65_01745 [Roseibacillus sp.]|nr:hypothetical protein [Roseibacillus sp.]
MSHIPELNVLLCVDLDAFDIRFEEAVSLENAGALFPLQLNNAGGVEYNRAFFGRSAIIKMHPVCLREHGGEAEKRKEDEGVE